MAINYTSISEFTEQLRIVISKEEGLCKQPKDIGDHTVTYGYGYTFIRKGSEWKQYEYLTSDLAAIGIVLTTAQTNALDAIAESLNTGKGATPAHAQLITDFATSLGKPDLTSTDAQTLFNAEWVRQEADMKSRFETLLGAVMGGTVFQNLENTREMVAVASLFYNSPALLGSGLARALRDGNRAEAWYEIRYNSNKLGWAQINGNATSVQQADINQNIDKGLAKRRFYEAELFSFYNTGDTTSDLAEATQAYKMFTTHRAMILQYEATYGNLNGQAGSRGDQIGEANSIGGYNLIGSPYEVNTLSDELKPAADVLIAEYVKADYGFSAADPFDPLNIQVASDNAFILTGEDTSDRTGSDADLLIGRDSGSDLLSGEGGNDLLIGQAGNDILVGGKGDDVLVGGKGYDTYIWNPGDGNDRIIEERESNGQISGIIKINNGPGHEFNAAGGFIKDGDDIITASAREQFYIDFPVSPFTKDVIWADVSGHWQVWHTDNFSLDDNGYLSLSFSGGVSYGTYTGASAMGGGWTYEFTVGADGVLDIKYFHPTEAPQGMVPAWSVAHGMMSEPLADKGVVLLGEGGNDVLVGHNQADYLSGGTEHDILTGNGGSDTLDLEVFYKTFIYGR